MNQISTEKAQAIATEYTTNGFNKVKTLLALGYKPSYANSVGLKIYNNVRVKEAIAKIQAKTEENSEITIKSIVERLNLVANRCLQEEPVLDNEGEETGEFRFDAGGANRALELLGKHLGMFKDKDEGPKQAVIVNLSPDKAVEAYKAKIRLLEQVEVAGTGICEE